MRTMLWLVPVVAPALLPAIAPAEVVYSNLSPSGTFTPGALYSTDLMTPNGYLETAWMFQPSATGEVSQMRLDLFPSGSPSTNVVLKLYEEAGGQPGAEVASWTVTIHSSGYSRAWTLPLSSSPLIHAGRNYFMTVRWLRGFPGGWNWYVSTWPPGPDVPSFYRQDGVGPWIDQGGQPIPGWELSVADCGSADFNHDGDAATDADIEAFFACIAGDCCDTCDSADFNHDGDVATDADIEAFFRVLAGGSC